ncbi:MAG TPA: hypothetical protein PKN62_01260 [bacterium]|nr:hypothetical protein [bacterium]
MKEFFGGFYKEENDNQEKKEEVVMSKDKNDCKNWKAEWMPEKAEEIKEYGEKIKRIHLARMAEGEDPFGFSAKVHETLKKKYGLEVVNNCLMLQLLIYSTPGSREKIFYDFPAPNSVREAIDKELEKMQN